MKPNHSSASAFQRATPRLAALPSAQRSDNRSSPHLTSRRACARLLVRWRRGAVSAGATTDPFALRASGVGDQVGRGRSEDQFLASPERRDVLSVRRGDMPHVGVRVGKGGNCFHDRSHYRGPYFGCTRACRRGPPDVRSVGAALAEGFSDITLFAYCLESISSAHWSRNLCRALICGAVKPYST